jgi:hypothetical protein
MQRANVPNQSFSWARALRLLRRSLEVLAIGSYLSLLPFGGLRSFDHLVSDFVFVSVALRLVLFSLLALLITQIVSLFLDWRWALFGLGRALVYLFLFGGTAVSHLGSTAATRPNQAMERTAGSPLKG